MLVPIGSWCRTAYQVNEFLKKNGIKPVSYPYDWTITPFISLKITLNNEFIPSCVLQFESIQRSKVNSIIDNSTQLIHHHDFSPPKIKELEQISELDIKGIPEALYTTNLIAKARERFIYTYRHLESLKSIRSKVLFVRWQRKGHPDHQFPYAFNGENIDSLANIIRKFLLHDNFSILIVKSKIIEGNLPEETIIEYEREKYGVSTTIIERKGFNGDGSGNFQGDTISWNKLLSKFVTDEDLDLKTNNHIHADRKKLSSFLARFFCYR